MTTALLVSLLVMPTFSMPNEEMVFAAWQRYETQLVTIDLRWNIVRDSRTPEFGPPVAARSWQLRLEGSRYCIDGERLTIQGRDDRPRPAETDPARARLEFRHVLLDERLAYRQTIPHRQPFTMVATATSLRRHYGFGELERLLAEAPLWAVRPLFMIDTQQIVATSRKASVLDCSCLVLEERRPDGIIREVWIDPAHEFRVVRMAEKANGYAVRQIDLTYVSDAAVDARLIPSHWTVLRLDQDGNVIEFATAERAAVQDSGDPSVTEFNLPATLPDDPVPLANGVTSQARIVSRIIMDWLWLPAGLVILAVGARCYQSRKLCQSALAGRKGGLQLFFGAIVAIAIAVSLRSVPILDPPLAESFREISVVWEQILVLRDRSANSCEWAAFTPPARASLESVTKQLEQTHHHRSGHSAWTFLFPVDRPTELARLDLIRVAKHDIPAVLRDPAVDQTIRGRSANHRLNLVEDHLAGISSYIPPLKPTALPANRERANNSAVDWTTPIVTCVLAGDMAVIVLLSFFWQRRRRIMRKRLAESETFPTESG
ncbi:MAG: hypothetical protein AABP62_21995 [Planctomycetota bacterium]